MAKSKPPKQKSSKSQPEPCSKYRGTGCYCVTCRAYIQFTKSLPPHRQEQERKRWIPKKPEIVVNFDGTCDNGKWKIRGKQDMFVKGFYRFSGFEIDYSRTAERLNWLTPRDAVVWAESQLTSTQFKSNVIGEIMQLVIVNIDKGTVVPLFEELRLDTQRRLISMADPRDIVLMRDRFSKELRKSLYK